MQFPGVLIHGHSRLGAAVAFSVVKIEGGDGMLAENAFKRDAAVHRLGCVISHTFIVVLPAYKALGQEVLTLRVETLWN